MISELLRTIAEDFFSEGGHTGMLIDEFNDSPEYNDGRARGHEDAYYVLQGLADHFAEAGQTEGAAEQ